MHVLCVDVMQIMPGSFAPLQLQIMQFKVKVECSTSEVKHGPRDGTDYGAKLIM